MCGVCVRGVRPLPFALTTTRGYVQSGVADPLPNAELGKGYGIMQYIELSPVAAFLLRVNTHQGLELAY